MPTGMVANMESDFLSTRLDPKSQRNIDKALRPWVPWYRSRRFILALATVAFAAAAFLLFG